MSIFLWYILPAILIVATFALKPLRLWLENYAMESVARNALAEEKPDAKE